MGTFWANADGLNVHFGTRYTGEQANVGEAAGPSGAQKTLTFFINAADFTSGTATYNGTTVTIPAGFTVKSVTAEVITAFAAMGGTTPTLNIGTVAGGPSVNRAAQFSNAQVQAVAPLDLTSTAAGTLAVATPLAASQTLTVGLGGTSPTVTSAVGKIQVMIRYEDPIGVSG
jgi:hypothetical protein